MRGIFVLLSDMAAGAGAHNLAAWLLTRGGMLSVLVLLLILMGLWFWWEDRRSAKAPHGCLLGIGALVLIVVVAVQLG